MVSGVLVSDGAWIKRCQSPFRPVAKGVRPVLSMGSKLSSYDVRVYQQSFRKSSTMTLNYCLPKGKSISFVPKTIPGVGCVM